MGRQPNNINNITFSAADYSILTRFLSFLHCILFYVRLYCLSNIFFSGQNWWKSTLMRKPLWEYPHTKLTRTTTVEAKERVRSGRAESLITFANRTAEFSFTTICVLGASRNCKMLSQITRVAPAALFNPGDCCLTTDDVRHNKTNQAFVMFNFFGTTAAPFHQPIHSFRPKCN